ncbi:maleylpyruvate isomerase family mycothiol-dependent enzyme [Nocardioides seonyuensis]|uniref:Maleylpyruvate isomerase family mycothiol-dependent enzyme n=1 Tax=Nocardioides seonyuensis TaxID=2518371 RepID=A0A4P7II39_9ACTN|nr:maleylpyruvate isomerase family mycothiol-dependent enzyme [Nocardioides seonyuensis]QBX56995.1 maleylpyruvate isomerase family mycothiol-dependent enzyme [Nocardioides seonyuensis]
MPLSATRYLAHIRDESARFREVLTVADPAARVPGCPDWDADDLLWHLTTVQQFWATMVIDRPSGPEDYEEPTRPHLRDDLFSAFDDASGALVAALDGVQPDDEAWTWHPTDHSVGFILRRQAHEALIHRLDAEQTAGEQTELDAGLAADGVLEVLDVMYGGCPPWGSWEPLPHLLRVDCTDTGDQFWIQLGRFNGTDPDDGTVHTDEEDLHVVASPGDDTEPEVVVDGPAGALDAWLWHRGTDEEISVAGDREVCDRFRAIVAGPIT